MKRDIDKIVDAIKEQFPEVKVIQMDKKHPVDDDGLWWFRLPGKSKDIQIESSTGECPFLVESDDTISSLDAVTAHTIDEAVKLISLYLEQLRLEK
jgi:hypothetical protein